MNTLLLQIVAVASSLVLALPPGWCSGMMSHQGAESAPVQATCCQRSASDQSSEPEPAEQGVECCCAWDATLPQKSVPPIDSDAFALQFGFEPAIAGRDSLPIAEAATNAGQDSGLRLHILQCVWLC